MPSLRKRLTGLMRQLSISNLAGAIESIGQGDQYSNARYNIPHVSDSCFMTRYLNGLETKHDDPLIVHGRKPEELTSKELNNFQENKNIIAAFTGPDKGLTTVNLQQNSNHPDIDYIDETDQDDHQNNSNAETAIAGVSDWFQPSEMAYGIATTLYEKNPITNVHNGEPIADCFSIIARNNSAILALADGVNWGAKAQIAARSAVYGCIEYLNNIFFNSQEIKITTTKDIFRTLLLSFHAAHTMILQEKGMLTTLTVCVVLPLSQTSTSTDTRNNKYVACTCNVGDSLAYVYSRKSGVREITRGSHDINCMRDMRDALGALGPVDGSNPELNNLTLAMTEVEEGDIVFLTSDGISDNFDPVVGKFAILPCSNSNTNVPTSARYASESKTKNRRKSAENVRHASLSDENSCNLPVVEAYQRYELTLLRMEDLLKKGISGEDPPCNDAKHLCELMVDFAIQITAAKRRILEDRDLYYVQRDDGNSVQLTKQEQRFRRKRTLEKMSAIPGKLDHATIAAYVVGYRSSNENNR